MSTSRRWPVSLLLAVAMICAFTGTFAATTEVQVALGDSVAGTIATPGTDMLMARFNAAAGTTVRITARADDGSTLQPTITVTTADGVPVAGGTTLQIEWLPVPNAMYTGTLPAAGSYVARFGASGGSGGFTGAVRGALPAGAELAAISGRITDSFSGAGLAGVSVNVGPFRFLTGADGSWGGQIPSGSYDVSVQASTYMPASQAVTVGGGPATVNLALVSTMPVVITAGVDGTPGPGAALTGSLATELRDGSTIQSIRWSQLHGVPVTITGETTETPTITLPAMTAFRDELITRLSEPAITAAQLPPNVPFPETEAPGGLQNRFQVIGVNPLALEETGLVELEVEVVTSSGTYHRELAIHAALPWAVSTGLRNVPVDVPVLLYGKEQASYDWTLLGAPEGSAAALGTPTDRTTGFTPDLPGLYTVEITDFATKQPVTVEVHAGTWRGVIVGQDVDGRPVSDGSCLTCHTTFAPDKFTPWAQTGHAEIFTNNLNTSTHYGSNCFSCHGVGFGAGDNGGFDDAADYAAFESSGLINHPGDNWTTVLSDFPATAKLANVQCENCHGPQSAAPGTEGTAHGWAGPDGEPRVGLSSDVCATCHGEPLRHARFQQWQLSGHANYELALDEGSSGSCSRCHTANGFLAWLPVLLDDDPETDPLDNVTVTWTDDDVHPQTCATCHDPHAIGTTSGNNTNATVRISGDTPPLIGGFTATDVGRGAICMTCHNSRRGPRNDSVYAEYDGTSESARAPHGSAQTDVLLGQNAYLVTIPQRGSHANLQDTCVTCHMEATDPPDLLAYNKGGSNHTFYASDQICAKCHDGLNGAEVQRGIQSIIDQVGRLIGTRTRELMAAQIAAGNTIDLNGAREVTNIAEVTTISLGTSRGAQAITVNFTDGASVGPYRLSDIDVLDSFSAVVGPLYEFASPTLLKAGWNYHLFVSDGSVGVHNPAFAWSTLLTTRVALSNVGKGTRLERADDLDATPMPGNAAERLEWFKRTLDRKPDSRR